MYQYLIDSLCYLCNLLLCSDDLREHLKAALKLIVSQKHDSESSGSYQELFNA